MDNLFDKYSKFYPDSSSEKVLKQPDFSNLLSSDLFKHNEFVYLSKIASFVSLDIFHILFMISDIDHKGYLKKDEFNKFTNQILLPKDNNNNNLKNSDLDSDINKVLFLICKLYNDPNYTTNSNIYSLNFSIPNSSFLSFVENYNPQDLPFFKSLLNDETIINNINNMNNMNNDVIDFKTFAKLMDNLPQLKFKSSFNQHKNSIDEISPSQLTDIAQNIFYNKLSPSIANHFKQFAYYKYGDSINYNDSLKLIKLLRDLPKLNYLTYEKLSSNDSKFYLTSNSLYNYIQNSSSANSSNHNITNDEVLLYFNWNRFTNDHLKKNPSIDPSELLAILTDDMVIPNDLNSPITATTNTTTNNNFLHIFKSVHSFILGSLAGMIGSSIVYPIDIIKTRMQNQKGNSLYSSYPNCFAKLVKNEGILGLYSGLLPQIIGVAPEKAIKLTLNDLIRSIGCKNSPNGDITLPWEILAGSTAGFFQVAVTNPLEVTKIRLQTQGELIQQSKISNSGTQIIPKNALQIVMELGPKGLYRGVTACLLRDIPFSSIYFPTYANIKKRLFNLDPGKPGKRSNLDPHELLISGALAGMPAAFLTTPCDVIKTRIQSKPIEGIKPYKGILPTFKRILTEEGIRAFYKGGVARVCKSSPQFGFTLAAYEMFQKTLPLSMFYETNNNNSLESKSSSNSSPLSLSNESKRFKLSSSASSADLNPTLLALTHYCKSLEDIENKKNKK